MSSQVDARIYWKAAKDLFDKANYLEAGEAYRKATEINPCYVDAYKGWGEALQNFGLYKEAAEKYQKATVIAPGDADAYNGWALALLRLGGNEEAIEKYKKAVELDPDHAQAYNGWGVALHNLNQFKEAIEKYRKATELDPTYAKPYANWALILTNENKHDEALAIYKKATDIDPKLIVAYFNWGISLFDKGKTEEAVEKYQKVIELNPKHADAYNNLGIVLLKQKKYEEAIEKYKKTIDIDPKYPYGHHNIANCLWVQGKYREGLEQWKKACQTYEDVKEAARTSRNADLFQYYGNVLHEIYGDLDQAERIYKEGLELKADHVGILLGLINLYLEVKDEKADQQTIAYWKARERYKNVEGLLLEQRKQSDDAPTLLKLGQLYLTMEEYEEAEKVLLLALEKDKDNADTHAALGVLCTRREDFAKGAQHFDTAINKDRGNLTIWSNLAEAHLKAKSVERALVEFKKILAITTDHVESLIGMGEVYTAIADASDKEMYGQAVNYFTEGIKVVQERKGSKRLKKKELAAVYYSRGYARVNLYESSKIRRDEKLLRKAREDFKNCSLHDPDHYKALQALEKIEKRFERSPIERLVEKIGPLVITLLSLAVFILTQGTFFFHSPATSIDAGYYTLLTFGSLMFMVAGLCLPQLLKLKVAGIELEKSVVDQITTSGTLGIIK